MIRAFAVKRWRSKISTPKELAIGALAAALAQIFTIPVSVITTRQQTSGFSKSEKNDDDKQTGLYETAKEIVREDGVTGLWTGLKASLVLVINPSITYGSFERVKAILYPGRISLSPRESFVIGALAKVLATIVTQPLIVAKVMQQSASKKYSSFVQILAHLAHTSGIKGLYRGIGPQISKGVLVQGLLFMFKDQVELLMVLLIRSIQKRRVAIL